MKIVGGLSNDEELFFKMSFLSRDINGQEVRINELKSIKAAITLARRVEDLEEQKELVAKFPIIADIMERVIENPHDVYLELMELESLQKYQQENICLLRKFIELFLSYCLPKAIWKRELELSMNWVEEALLMELIPYTTSHEFWDKCVQRVEQQITNVFAGKCRTCGKGIKMWCQECKKSVGWCSIKCKNKKDIVFEHKHLECKYYKNKV
jgi:hypothetical protein